MIAGIIPGARGGIALLNKSGGLICTMPMPSVEAQSRNGSRQHMDVERLVTILDDERIERFVVERVAPLATPDASFSLAFSAGIIKGVIGALDAPCLSVSHREWRADFSIPDEYWAAVGRVTDLTFRRWPAMRFAKSVCGHRQQCAALLGLYAMQCSHTPPPAFGHAAHQASA